MNKILITSNGEGHGTTVNLVDADGTVGPGIPGLRGATWTVQPGKACVARLEACDVAMKAHAQADLKPLVRLILDQMDPIAARDFAAELALMATFPRPDNAGPLDPVIAVGEFPGQTTVIAKNQPEYRPLPSHLNEEGGGRVTFCWKPTGQQMAEILRTGEIWHQVALCGSLLQPQLLLASRPPEIPFPD